MVDIIQEEIIFLQKCALDLLVGDKIGGGSTRRVYALRHNPDMVVKIEYASKKFCNVAEYDVWHTVRGSKWAKFFAPVIDIDVWAGALIQRRTTPITTEELLAELPRLPDFMGDIHYANFGRMDGRIVCHDYGFHRFMTTSMKKGKMVATKTRIQSS